MSRLILLTGFLGSGKTTFLLGLLRLYAGKRVHVIVNEFGQVGVDGKLLPGVGTALTEIVNGSIFCACRLDQFEAALEQTRENASELILVEASGLSDPTAIRTVLEQTDRFNHIEYRGCIALADATRLHKVIDTARVCARQLSVADSIILTKTDIAPQERIQAVRTLLSARYPGIPVYPVSHGAVTQEMLDSLTLQYEAVDTDTRRDLTLQKYLLEVSPGMSSVQLTGFLKLIAEDTYRIKGFVRLQDGCFYADCVGAYVKLTPAGEPCGGNALVALAGEGMPLRQSLQNALAWYAPHVREAAPQTD